MALYLYQQTVVLIVIPQQAARHPGQRLMHTMRNMCALPLSDHCPAAIMEAPGRAGMPTAIQAASRTWGADTVIRSLPQII